MIGGLESEQDLEQFIRMVIDREGLADRIRQLQGFAKATLLIACRGGLNPVQSYNVAGGCVVTRVGVGDYRVTHEPVLGTLGYAVGAASPQVSVGGSISAEFQPIDSTSFAVRTRTSAAVLNDDLFTVVAVG